jgi:hypothetical protein
MMRRVGPAFTIIYITSSAPSQFVSRQVASASVPLLTSLSDYSTSRFNPTVLQLVINQQVSNLIKSNVHPFTSETLCCRRVGRIHRMLHLFVDCAPLPEYNLWNVFTFPYILQLNIYMYIKQTKAPVNQIYTPLSPAPT